MRVPIFWSSLIETPILLHLQSSYIGNNSEANGINNKGEIVGYATLNAKKVPLFWSSSTANPTILSVSSYSNYSVAATGINDDSIIIGYYTSDEIIYISIDWILPTSIQPVQFNSNPYINTIASGIL